MGSILRELVKYDNTDPYKFSKLVGIIDSNIDLFNYLADHPGLTLFAPTDEAFNKLPTEVLSNDALMEAYVFNLISNQFPLLMSTDLTDGKKIDTILEEQLTITVNSDGDVKLNNATIKTFDIETDDNNNVIHVIDTVLTTKKSPWGMIGRYEEWGDNPDFYFEFNDDNVLEIKNYTFNSDTKIKFRKLMNSELQDELPIDGNLVSNNEEGYSIPVKKGKYSIKLYPEKADDPLNGPDYELNLSYSLEELNYMIAVIRKDNKEFEIKLDSMESIRLILVAYDLAKTNLI